MSFPTLFVRPHEFGTICAISIPDGEPSEIDIARLHPDEAVVLSKFKRSRRSTWVGGRLALAQACEVLGHAARPLLNDERGAPVLPKGLTGSLTHKNSLAVALVAPSQNGMRLGVDVESMKLRQSAIERMILTDEERAIFQTVLDSDKEKYLVSRFSLKESIYKAIDPFVQRYVGFKEVEIVETDDTIGARFMLKDNEGPFDVELRSEVVEIGDEKLLLTSARATHL